MHEFLNQAIKLDDVSLLISSIEKVKIQKNDKDLDEILYLACKAGKLNISKYLIEQKKRNPSLMIDNTMASDNGPVFKFAAESGNLELVKYLFEKCHVDIEARGQYAGTQDTALSRASRKGHYDIVKYLLEKGANPNAKISYGTILGNAIVSCKIEVVKILVSAGTKIDDSDLNDAIKRGELEIVKYLIQQGADIHGCYLDPYAQVAAKSGNIELLKFLEENGLHVLDSNPHRPWIDQQHEMLMAAAEGGSVEMMRYLVETHKLDVVRYVQKENSGEYAYKYDAYSTILGKAVSGHSFSKKEHKNRIDLIHYLFDELKLLPPKNAFRQLQTSEAKFSGIKVNACLDSYLTESESEKKLLLTISENGLEGVNVPTLFQLYTSGLITEGSYHHFEDLLRKRIENMALSNEQLSKFCSEDKDFFRNALFYYAEYRFDKNFEKLKYLINQGADINATNNKGENVVRHAVTGNGYNIVSNGANVDQPCARGLTAINVLGRQLNANIAAIDELLKSAKDYTNSLKEACQCHWDRSLIPILKHSNGAIGHANAQELLESALKSGRVRDLLEYVSPSVFKEMKRFLQKSERHKEEFLKWVNKDNYPLLMTLTLFKPSVALNDITNANTKTPQPF